MKYDRVQNTRRNARWGFLEKGAALLLPFLVRTALIRRLGLGYAGIGGLFTSALQILSLAELGLSSAVVHSLYAPLAQNDTDKICALLRYYRKAYRWVGLIVILLGAALFSFLPWLMADGLPRDVSLLWVYGAYLAHAALGYFVFPERRALLLAAQRRDVISRVSLLIRFAAFAGQMAALLLSRNYHFYILFLPLSALGDQLLCAREAKRIFPQYVCRGVLDDGARGEIIQKTKGLFVHRLLGQSRNAFDQLFVSAFFGLVAVGMYGNYFYILQSVRGLLDVITASMSAGVGNSVAMDSAGKNYRDFCTFTFLYEALCGVCAACLMCLYQPFMALWCGRDALFSTEIAVAFCVYFYVWTMGDIKSQYSDARGLWWKNRFRTLCEAVSNIVLNALLARWLGVFGIVIATALSILLVGFPWSTILLFRDFFPNQSPGRYMADQGLYALTAAAACAASWLLCGLIPAEGIGGLLLRLIVCVLCSAGLYCVCFCKTVRFRQAVSFLRRAWRREQEARP